MFMPPISEKIYRSSQRSPVPGEGSTFAPLPLLLFLFFAQAIVPGCKSGPAVSGTDSAGKSQSSSSADGTICRLEGEGSLFRCDFRFPAVGKGRESGQSKDLCERSLGRSQRMEFVNRMVQVSLSMLYLDGEPGASPPYRYNDPDRLIRDLHIESCGLQGNSCECRISYADPFLQQILYDSAGCRMRSRFGDRPLYFRGNGCM